MISAFRLLPSHMKVEEQGERGEQFGSVTGLHAYRLGLVLGLLRTWRPVQARMGIPGSLKVHIFLNEPRLLRQDCGAWDLKGVVIAAYKLTLLPG